jgi:protein-S-isoprenylcysteine O-methyltransferase Ste14
MSRDPDSFAARGGWWVAAQLPMLSLAAALPPWAAGTWPMPVRVSGWALFALGLLVSAAAALSLGRSLTPFPRPRADGQFCGRGLYRRVRHPIYTGVLVASLGWALAWQSLAGLLFLPLLFVFFDLKARREERWLAERYPEYRGYCRNVRRFFPGVY